MSAAAWACAVLTLVSFDALAVAWLLRRQAERVERPERWFDHTRFLDRVRVYAPAETILHPCSFGGDLIEYRPHPGFQGDAVHATLAEIEAL